MQLRQRRHPGQARDHQQVDEQRPQFHQQGRFGQILDVVGERGARLANHRSEDAGGVRLVGLNFEGAGEGNPPIRRVIGNEDLYNGFLGAVTVLLWTPSYELRAGTRSRNNPPAPALTPRSALGRPVNI